MTFRRRTRFGTLEQGATKELIGLQDEIASTIEQLRGEAVGTTTDSKQANYSAKYNEFIRCLPPAAGIDITFPVANSTAQNRWIWVLKVGGGNVRLRATSGKINGVTTVITLPTAGLYIYQSDGLDSWWSTASGGGLPPDGVYGDITVSGGGTVWTVTSGGGTNPRIFAWFGV